MGRRAQERKARRDLREPRATEIFGSQSRAVLDILELTDWAWHSVYGDDSPSERVVNDIFACADGDLAMFALAAKEAVNDCRNVHVWADQVRARARAATAAAATTADVIDDIPQT
jgi:hypothetical protein